MSESARTAELSGATHLAAVIGHPVRHSRSPAIHNAAFAQLGLDWAYLAFDVAPGHGAAAVEAMRVLGLGGLSVTMPHKQEVVAAVDRLAPEAARLDAVNCIAWEGDELVGHNTDGAGFLASLDDAQVDPSDASVAVVGAGGAARAVVLALVSAGAAAITVHNRAPDRRDRAVELADPIGRAGTDGDLAAAELIVNATPVGMDGAPGLPLDASLLRPEQVVIDLIYEPERTELVAAAHRIGARTVGGMGMLVHQAAVAFEHWTGVAAPLEAMKHAAALPADDFV